MFPFGNTWTEISKRSTFDAIGRCESNKTKEEIEGFLLVVTTMLYNAQNAGKLQKKIYFFLSKKTSLKTAWAQTG